MPIFLRRFYIKQVEKSMEEKAKAMEEAASGNSSKKSVLKPGISPK